MVQWTYIIWRVEYAVSKQNRPQALGFLLGTALRLTETETRMIVVILDTMRERTDGWTCGDSIQFMSDFFAFRVSIPRWPGAGRGTHQLGIVGPRNHWGQRVDKDVYLLSLAVVMRGGSG